MLETAAMVNQCRGIKVNVRYVRGVFELVIYVGVQSGGKDIIQIPGKLCKNVSILATQTLVASLNNIPIGMTKF